MKSYRDLEIYQIAYKLAIKVHEMSLNLPKYELYEQGSQVRRSSKSVKDNIVEACLPARQGYGRKRYKDDFIKFLIYSQSSCDETISHLNLISDIHFNGSPLNELISEYDILGKKINKFIQFVEESWMTSKTSNK